MGAKDYKFLQDYEQIRKLIRMQFLYDDFTVDHAANIGLGVSRYNELKSTLAAYIKSKDDNIENKRINNRKTFSLKNSMFINGYNYLCDTFGAKNVVPSQFEGYIHILQLLYQNGGKPMRLAELISKGISSAEISTTINHIKELEDMGYVKVEGGYQKQVSLSKDCLSLISRSEEMVLFLDMISLMSNIIQPYLCGNMLFNTALAVFKKDSAVSEYQIPFTFAQSHFEQVLDDEIVWKLIGAIHHMNKTSLKYRGDDRVVSPLEIVTNAETGRRYLLAADEQSMLISMRMDQISYVVATEEIFDAGLFKEQLQAARKYSFTGAVLLPEGAKPQTVELEFLPSMKDTLERLFPDIEITADDNICMAKVLINDPREIIPWLRRNIGSVKAKDGTPLAEEMAKDAEKWRKVYGIV